MREERESLIKYIYIFFLSYNTIAITYILSISGTKNSNIAI